MKTINIRIPITEIDLGMLDVIKKGVCSSIVYSFDAEDADINVQVHFIKEDEDNDN